MIADQPDPNFATAAFAAPREWGYVGLVAFTMVLLLRPQDTIPFLEPLHIAELCALVGLAPMLVHRFTNRRPVFRVTPETTALLAFGAVMVATVPFSIWPADAFGTFVDSYLKIVLVFVLMMNTLTSPKRLEQLTWLIVVCVGYVAARGLIDYARGRNLVEGGRLAGPIGGIFGNPNDLALNLVTFMPIAIVVAISPRNSWGRRIAACMIAGLMLTATVLTGSRGGAIGLAVMLVSLLFVAWKVRPRMIVVAVAGVLLTAPFMPSSFWARMNTIIDDREDQLRYTGSREARRRSMQEGIDTFIERPLTGVGVGQFKNYNPPERRERWRETHNALIQVAAETGVFGLLTFSFLIVRAVLAAASTRRALRRPKRRGMKDKDPVDVVLSAADRAALHDHAAAMLVALITWFTCAMFASVAYNWTFYYLLALIVAARELTRDRLAVARELLNLNGRSGRSKSAAASRTRSSRTLVPGVA
jgi:probable O-glycosylation ligase (exosortase A-associated)